MRVLILNEFFHPDNQGGTATSTTNIATRLRDQHNCDVSVITGPFAYRDPAIKYGNRESWNGIEIYRANSPNWSRDRMMKRFAGNLILALTAAGKGFSVQKPDVVLTTTAPLTFPITARILKTFRGVPYVYLIYDLDPDRTVALHVKSANSREVKMMAKAQTKWLNGASRVIAIGRCMKDHLVAKYGLSPSKVDVVEVGADPDVVRPMPRDTKFRREQGLTGFVVLYSGNFGQYHDFETILGAAEKMRESHPEVNFVLVGGGNKKKSVEEAVVARKLTNVRVLNFVPEEDLADMLSSADLNVVTLEPGMEGLCVPSKFYTCLASGRPTLALMRPGTEVSMVVEEAQCGVVADIGDVDGMVKVILDSVANPAEQDERGRRGREVFDRLYTIDRVVDKLYVSLKESAKT